LIKSCEKWVGTLLLPLIQWHEEYCNESRLYIPCPPFILASFQLIRSD
jgi:hypothetical protein